MRRPPRGSRPSEAGAPPASPKPWTCWWSVASTPPARPWGGQDRQARQDGGALSCVKVTVTNQTKKQLEVNPLYFSITDSDSTKHDTSTALGDYEGQIAS